MAAHGALGARAGRARRLLPPAAQAGRPPHASPTTCGGAGIREARILFSRIDAGGWARYRNPIPVLSGPGRLGAAPRQHRRSWPTTRTSSPSSQAYMSNGADHWFQRRHAKELEGPIAYFCAEYGLHESLGIYSGGLGVLAGDHMKTASDMALPLIGVGLMYRKGYFRQTIDADGHQEHAYPDYELVAPADPARARPARRAAHGQRPAARAATCSPPSGSSRSAGCPCCCSTPTSPTTTTPTARSRTSCTSAAARCGSTRSSSSASAASGRCGRWASTPRSGTSTRATPRSCSPSAPASSSPEGAALDDAFDRGPAQQRVHDPHAGRRGQRALRRRPRPAGRRSAARRRRAAEHGRRARSSGSWSSGLGVENDPAQFDMTAFCLRMTHGANAVSQLHAADRQRDLAGRQPARDPRASPTASTRRPGSASRCATRSSGITNADLDDDGRPAGRAALLGAHRQGPGRRAVGGAPAPEAASSRSSPAAGCAASSPATARRRRRSRSSTSVLDPTILTIGFARRFATYKRAGAAVHATSTGWRACCGTRSGRCRSSSPARPTRPTGPARA